jgi:hypothetical protein
MTFGGQTATFVVVSGTGTYDSLGGETVTRTETAVTGCRHRPLRFDETPEWVTNIATQVWKTTAPPVAAAMAANAKAELIVGGVRYRVIAGAEVFTDQAGTPHKVTILSEKQDA